MPIPSNPRQAALDFLDGENFSPDSYFEAWNLDNSISGISATTIDENGDSREFQRANLDCFDRSSSPIDGDTLFNIASMTKMMTAATILRMMESEEFAAYFPDKLKTKLSHFYDFIEARYPKMAYVTSGRLRGENEEITLENLLTHTSGIPDMNPAEARKLPLEGMADGKFLDHVTIRKEPGELEYTDIGFELLGLAISAIATHQAAKVVSCQEMIRKMVIEKLEMQNTYTSDQMSLEGDRVIVKGHPDKKIARGFILNDDNIIENRNFTRCISCAAVYSTPKEMCKFVTALFSDKTFANGGLFKTSDSIDLHNSARVTQIENGAPKSDALGDWYFGIGFRFIEKDNKK